MEPVGKQRRLPVAVAAANYDPAAAIDVNPFFVFVAGADASAHRNVCFCTDERDWENLLLVLMPKVAELALRSEVTDYIRLRAVCKPWRGAAEEEPRLMGLDPRFFPRNWEMVEGGARRGEETCRFVNTLAGASIHLQIPREYGEVIASAEGCLLLALGGCCTQKMRLFNPVTKAVADLPAVLLPDCLNLPMRCDTAGFIYETKTVADADADADPTVVLCVTAGLDKRMVYTKPGDTVWRVVDDKDDDGEQVRYCEGGALSVRGRFYVPTPTGDVLEVKLRPRPQLVYVARQEARHRCRRLGVFPYLERKVDDAHDGMLLVRNGIHKAVEEFSVNITEGSLTLVQDEDVENILPWLKLRTVAPCSLLFCRCS